MHVHFKVHGTGKELFGDGFAIWYVRDPKLGGTYSNTSQSKRHSFFSQDLYLVIKITFMV